MKRKNKLLIQASAIVFAFALIATIVICVKSVKYNSAKTFKESNILKMNKNPLTIQTNRKTEFLKNF